ncbi:phospholipase [Verrucomicrobiales bacterium]|nr:phospholipase [Verrucomicrobiales bacterium]MDA7926982.1 phospholipase [Verrucomicrobiales bacterium]MDB4358944.1 phospholipase [Verrucomicrobiales bacterium]
MRNALKSIFPILAGISLIVLPSCKTTEVAQLVPFQSDGCTSFPDGPKEDPKRWCFACDHHDFTYWQGGSFADRLAADKKLKAEISETGHPIAAAVAFAGIRVGGSPLLPTPWRWGYGWKQFPRTYGTLTEEESGLVSKARPAALESIRRQP